LQSKLPIAIVPIEDDGFHIMVDVKINGKKARLLVDTGASRSVFDMERIKKFIREEDFITEENEKLSTGLGTDSMESQSVTIKKIQLGDIKINDYRAIILEMGYVNASYEKLKLPGIDGVLGSDLLVELKATIDYKKEELILVC
jgi:predicted aspartyl protease